MSHKKYQWAVLRQIIADVRAGSDPNKNPDWEDSVPMCPRCGGGDLKAGQVHRMTPIRNRKIKLNTTQGTRDCQNKTGRNQT